MQTKPVVTKRLPVGPPETVERERRNRWRAWAVAGVLGLLVVVGGLFVHTNRSTAPSINTLTGISQEAWAQYRAGERAGNCSVIRLGRRHIQVVDIEALVRAAG